MYRKFYTKKSERCDLKQYESSLKRKIYDKNFL